MSIFTLVFPAQASNTVMPASVDTVALSMLCLGLMGIVATLITAMRAKRVRRKNAPVEFIRA